MRSLIVWLALAITTACTFLFIAQLAPSQVDIDYSHSVVGTGTLITDYHMEAEQRSEASGRVRGTGNVMNKYLFLSGNDSQNVTIEDQFTLSGKSNVASKDLTFSSFPPGPENPDTFRLTGAAWADGLVVLGTVSNSNLRPQSSERLKVQNVSFSQEGNWYNSSMVAVKSLVGGPKTSIYEDDGPIAGESTGQKSLIVSP